MVGVSVSLVVVVGIVIGIVVVVWSCRRAKKKTKVVVPSAGPASNNLVCVRVRVCICWYSYNVSYTSPIKIRQIRHVNLTSANVMLGI